MTKQVKTEVIVKDLPKTGGLETANVYIKNVPVFYAAVHEPKPKFQSTDKEYSLTAFVDEEAKDRLLDEVMVNKGFLEVGKGKTSKPPRKIKFPLSSQVEEGKVNYDIVDGLWGFSATKAEFSKKGKPMSVTVIDTDGKPFTENVGNGSIVNLKLFGYKNVDNQLVVSLDTVQVVEHVPYESKTSDGVVQDDVLGSYAVKKVETKQEAVQEVAQSKAVEAAPEEDFDESLPF